MIRLPDRRAEWLFVSAVGLFVEQMHVESIGCSLLIGPTVLKG
jgi:hypothetical protein